MKIIQQNLKKYMHRANIDINGVVDRLNAMQELIDPTKRKITRSSIYFYLYGKTPPLDKIYMISAILNVHPKKLFTVVYDEPKLKEMQELAKSL